MKICTKCKNDYPVPLENYFNKKSSTKDGFQHCCKKCVALFHKEHYQARTDYYKKKARIHNSEYVIRNLQYTIDYLKIHPCVDCGETDPVVLEFDHLGDKFKAVSQMRHSSLEMISEEIAKCEVRCCNCHRKKTAKQLGWYKDIKL